MAARLPGGRHAGPAVRSAALGGHRAAPALRRAACGAGPFPPDLGTGIALLLGRFILSQMDVPARQAYVVAVVDPDERTAAAAYTNSARYAARPIAPILAGALVQASTLAAPFVIAGALKS